MQQNLYLDNLSWLNKTFNVIVFDAEVFEGFLDDERLQLK